MINKNVLKDLFSKITIPSQFGGDIDGEDYTNIDEWVSDIINKNKLNNSIEYRHGVSKAVFIFNNLNFVIKIPFNGSWECEYGLDKDSDRVVEISRDWYDFITEDYCEKELSKYTKAKEKGLEIFFAAVDNFTLSENRKPIYIQEKVIPFYEYEKENKISITEEHEMLARRLRCDFHSRLFDSWIAAAIKYYGFDLTKKFLSFIEKEDYEIGADLHSGNYGFRENGTPCLLDYSGWEEDI